MVNIDAVDSRLVVLIESDADVLAKLDDTVAKLALAVVRTLAVDSKLVVLVDKDAEVATNELDTSAKDALAVVSTDAVDSRLVARLAIEDENVL